MRREEREAEERRVRLEQQIRPGSDFYGSRAWRALRYKVLVARGARCEVCGRTPRDHGVIVHVDHIMPRSQFPDLALEETNLQVACEDCNIGKGTGDTTDWRPETQQLDEKMEQQH